MIEQVRQAGNVMRTTLGLLNSPVGVALIGSKQLLPAGAQVLQRHRYCQALMRARHGEDVLLTGGQLACPAAAAVFGFRPLPAKLQSGEGLVGFGIVSDPLVGRRMFEGMPCLESGAYQAIHLFPLEKAPVVPDVIVVEDEVEKLMWIVLAYLHATGGERVSSSTAVLQATCVDATVIPYQESRLNPSFGCYGCRDATDIGPNETVLGFPIQFLNPIADHLAFLDKKAMPQSQSKGAWQAWQRQG